MAEQPAVVRHTDGPESFCRYIFCRWRNPKFEGAKNVVILFDHEDDVYLIHVNDKLTQPQGA